MPGSKGVAARRSEIRSKPSATGLRVADRPGVLGALMLSPALVYVTLLIGLPFLLAIVLSLSNATAGSLSFSLVGLKNFVTVIGDPVFRSALSNTLLFTLISQLLVVILATVLTLVLEADFRGKRLFRFILLMPWAAPVVLATMAWTWIFDSTFSVINWTLRAVGLLGPGEWLYWLGVPALAMASIIIVHVWRMVPFATVVMLAGLTSIPTDIVEAAVIDGAGFWRRLFAVKLPLLLPVVAVAVLFGVVFTATDLSIVYLLTAGGPYNSTHVLASLTLQQGILGADLGQGAAIAIFLLPLLLAVAVFMLRGARSTEVG